MGLARRHSTISILSTLPTMPTMKRLLLTAVLAVSSLALTPPATAQFGGRSVMVQAFEPYVMQRDLPIMVETLQLDESQRPIVDMLVEDYLASFQAGIEKVRAQMQEAGSSAEKGDLGALLRPLATWSKERQELYARFTVTMRNVLSPQQAERWPIWERAVRRERLLPQSEISGEGVNLIGVIADIAPPAEVRTVAAPAIEAYELRVDMALQDRQMREEEALPAIMDAMTAMDHDRAAQVQERVMASRLKLREAQEVSIREISEAMGSEWGTKFRVLALQRAFPEVHAPNSIMRIFDAALGLTDLTDDQRTSITALRGEFEREWALASDQLLEAVKRDEPLGPRRRAGANAPAATPAERQARGGEVEAARRKRHDLSERYRQQLEKLLTPEQYAQLPGAQKYAAEGMGSKFGSMPAGGGATQESRPAGGRAVPGSDKSRGGNRGGGVGNESPGGNQEAAPTPAAVE